MENPFIGKRADVLNKKGIVSFFHKRQEEAVSFWAEALNLSDRHFDAKTNLSMQQWSTGQISDDRLLQELESFVFEDANKGMSLYGFLLIAQGEREQGIRELRKYLEQMKLSIEKEKAETRILNLKKQEYIKVA